MIQQRYVYIGLVLATGVGAFLCGSRGVNPETARMDAVARRTLPNLEMGVEREILYKPDLKKRSDIVGLAPLIREYRESLKRDVLGIDSVTTPISAYEPVVEKLQHRLTEKGVTAPEQARIIRQLGKYLYNEAMITTGYDRPTRLLKIRLLKISLAHMEAVRGLEQGRKL